MKVKLGLILLFVVVGIYFVRVDYGRAPLSDENLYYYMAKEVSEGSVPYRDFFFAHPPGLILPQAFLFWIFGPGILLGRLIPILSGAAILVLAYLIGNELEKGSGIFASAVILSSYSFWLMSGRGIGVALSLALILGSVYLSLRKKEDWAGLLLGLSLFVRLSNFPLFLVLVGYHVWKKRWRFFRGLAILGVFGFLTIIPNFTKDVFLYHVLKSAVADRGGAIAFASREWILLLLVALGAFVKWTEKRLLILGCAASGVLVLLLSQVRIFYLGFVIPFVAIVAGIGIVRGMEKFEKLKYVVVLIFLAVLALNGYAYRFEYSGVDPALDGIFAEIDGPVFDTSSTFAAYYSVEYGSRISGKVIDMYPVRVMSGMVEWDDVVGRLDEDTPRFIFDKRGEFVGENEREAWLKTPLKDFVYDNYVPSRFVSAADSQEIIIMWKEKEVGNGVVFTGNIGSYYVKYYSGGISDGVVLLEEKEAMRQGKGGDVLPSEEFVSFLGSHVVFPKVVAVGAWDVSEIGEGYHWVVPGKVPGEVSSETWVNEYDGSYVLFTESRDSEKTVAFLVQIYVPGQGIIMREVYQNIGGGFVKVYEERLV